MPFQKSISIPKILAAAALSFGVASCYGYSTDLVVSELGGTFITDELFSVANTAEGVVGAISTSGASAGFASGFGMILGKNIGLELNGTPVDISASTSGALNKVAVSGVSVTQTFIGAGGFSIRLINGSNLNVLSGSITGGAIHGQLGSTHNVDITFDIAALTSDILALPKKVSTLTLTGDSDIPLALTCFGQAANQPCSAAESYLSSFKLWGHANYGGEPTSWSVSPDTFTSTVPEPQSWSLLSIGAVLVAARIKKQRVRQ